MYVLPFRQFISLTERKQRRKSKRPSFLDVLAKKKADDADDADDEKNDTPIKPKMLKISLEI